MSQTYNFGSGSFTNELWVSGKRVFENLKEMNVEFLTGGEWSFIVADATGAVVSVIPHTGPGGWASINLPSHGLYGAHSIGFRSTSPGTKKIRAGDLTFG